MELLNILRFVHSPVDAFLIFAIMNKAAMYKSLCEHMPSCLLGKYLRLELLDIKIGMCLTL